MCVYICVCVCVCRERERERERLFLVLVALEFLLWPVNQKPNKTLTWTQKIN